MKLQNQEKWDFDTYINVAQGHYRATLGRDCGINEGEVKAQLERGEFLLAQIKMAEKNGTQD